MTVVTTHCQKFQILQRSIYLGHQVKGTQTIWIFSNRTTEVSGTLKNRIPVNQETKYDSHHITGKLELPCCRL